MAGGSRRSKKKLIDNPDLLLCYRLSIDLGIPVSEVPDRVSSNELVHYAAYYQLYPSTVDLLDHLIAVTYAANSDDRDVTHYLPNRFKVQSEDEENPFAAFMQRMDHVAAMQQEQGKIKREKM